MSDPPPGTPHDPTRVVGRRIAAFAIDTVLLAVAAAVVFVSIAEKGKFATCTEANAGDGVKLCAEFGSTLYTLQDGAATGYLGVVFLLWIGYHGVLQALAGATVGKALLGIAVVDARGERAGMGRTVVRTLPFAIGSAVVGIGFAVAVFVGLIMLLAQPQHRRVFDLVAGTFVVRRGDVGRPPVAPAGDP